MDGGSIMEKVVRPELFIGFELSLTGMEYSIAT